MTPDPRATQRAESRKRLAVAGFSGLLVLAVAIVIMGLLGAF